MPTTNTLRHSVGRLTEALRKAKKNTSKARGSAPLRATRSSSLPCTRMPGNWAARRTNLRPDEDPLLSALCQKLHQAAGLFFLLPDEDPLLSALCQKLPKGP